MQQDGDWVQMATFIDVASRWLHRSAYRSLLRSAELCAVGRPSRSDLTKDQAIPIDDPRHAPTHLAIAPQKGMLLRTALSFNLAPVLWFSHDSS